MYTSLKLIFIFKIFDLYLSIALTKFPGGDEKLRSSFALVFCSVNFPMLDKVLLIIFVGLCKTTSSCLLLSQCKKFLSYYLTLQSRTSVATNEESNDKMLFH